jgi:hypothetical protein
MDVGGYTEKKATFGFHHEGELFILEGIDLRTGIF